MYHELADWFHLLTAPEEYIEEADTLRRFIEDRLPGRRSMLEMGSGGGNLASHLKSSFDMTLMDLSQEMISLSKTINPELPHLTGDMRTFRIQTKFDVVLVHDAIMYMTTSEDLQAAIDTANFHCKADGLAIFIPDCTTEEFTIGTSHGGNDTPDNRGFRYLEWTQPPGKDPHQYQTDYSYLVRDKDGSIQSYHESHLCGLFSTQEWLNMIGKSGFIPGFQTNTSLQKYLYGIKPAK
jgi:trans-aconitate methyltransferase